MAELGNLQFSILYKDDPEQLEKIKERALKKLQEMNLVTKVSGTVNKKELLESVKAALSSERFRIGVVVDKAGAAKAVREALDKAGLDTGYTVGDLRAERARATAARAEAYVNSQRELTRRQAALAAKAELGLAAARERGAGAANNGARASFLLGEGMNANIRISGELRNQMMGVYSLYTIERFISGLVRIRGEFDMQLISLKAIMQSGEKATELFNQIKSLSVISPFQFRDLIGFSKQLSAYQIPNSELFDTTKRLADLSAGLGVDMNRIILAYGQVRSAAFLRGQELRQFTEAGIPMVQALADKFSLLEGSVVSTGEVFDRISRRKVPFEMVKEVMEDLTDEGGRFYMMQEKQSESLRGKVSNLRDTYDIMMNSIGEANDRVLKGGVDALSSLMENMDKLMSVVSALLPVYGVYRMFVALNNVALGKETRGIISSTLAEKAKRAEMLGMAGMYRNLTEEERVAISTRKQMTMADWRAVASSGALSKEYALRLVRLGRLTELQAMELGGIYVTGEAEKALYQSQVKKAVSMRTNIQLGQRMTRVFGVFGVTSEGLTRKVNSLRLGLSGVGRGMGNALSSVFSSANMVMMAVTALGYVIANYLQEGRELGNRIRQTEDAIKGSYDELIKFLSDNPLSIAFNSGDEGVKAFLEKLKNQVKESSPIWVDILAESDGIEDGVERMNFLREALEDTARAYLAAGEAKDVFERANEKTDDWGIDDKLDKNLNDYAEAIGKFNYELNSIKRPDLLSKLPVFGENADEIRKNIERLREVGKSLPEIYDYYYEAFAKNAQWNSGSIQYSKGKINELREGLEEAKKEVGHDFDVFYGELEAQIKSRGIDVGSKFGKSFVERLKKEYFTQHNIQPAGQELFNFKLDSKLIGGGLYGQSEAVLNEITRLMKLKGKEAVREFSDSGVWGEGMDNALGAAIDEVRMKFPEFKEAIDKTINNQEFNLSIKTIFEVPDEAEIQKWAKSVYLSQLGLLEGTSDPKLVNGALKDFRTSGLRPGNDVKSAFEYIDKLRQKADEYNDKIDELTKVYQAKKSETVKKELDGYIKDRDAILGQLAGSGYKYVRKGSGGGKDEALELLKERFRQAKDFLSMYEKLSDTYGRVEALRRTKGSGLFAADLFKGSTVDSVSEDVRKEVAQILKDSGGVTKDRRSLTESALSYTIDLGVKVDKEALEGAVSEIGKFVSDTTKKWGIYKQLIEAGAGKEEASVYAFGAVTDYDRKSEELRDSLQKKMEEKGIYVPFTFTEEEAAEALGGKDGVLYKQFFQAWKEVKDAIGKDGLEITLKEFTAINKYKSIAEKIRGLSEKYAPLTGGFIGGDGELFGNEDAMSTGQKALFTEYKEEVARLKGELLELLPVWEQIFGDQTYKSYGQVQLASAAAQQIVHNAKVTKNKDGKPVSYTSWYDDADGNRKDVSGRYSQIEKLRKIIHDLYKEGLNKNPFATLVKNVKELFAKNGDEGGKKLSEKLAAVGESAAGSAQLVGTFAGQLSDMFDALGDEDMAELMDNLEGVMSSISNIGEGFAKGGIVGGVAAVAGEAVGWIGKIANAHSERMKKIIEQNKKEVQWLQNKYDLVESSISRYLGNPADLETGEMREDRQELARINGELDRIMNRGAINFFDVVNLQKYSQESEKLEKRMAAADKRGAFGYQQALMQEQLEKLESSRKSAESAGYSGKPDKDQIEDLDKQIADLKSKIKYFAEDTAKDLYGIDLKEWASQLGDALFEAWKKGEDGAEAFKNKSADILGNVMNQALKLQILEPAMKKLQRYLFGYDAPLFGHIDGVFGKSFKMDESKLEKVGDYLMGLKGESEAYNAAMEKLDEYMEKRYGVSMKDEAEGGGLSKGIKGVTEDTADLLASYLNSVRADVAAQLALVRLFVGEHFPRMNLLAEAQLTELKGISRNTADNVAAVREIRDMLSAARLSKDRGFWIK